MLVLGKSETEYHQPFRAVLFNYDLSEMFSATTCQTAVLRSFQIM